VLERVGEFGTMMAIGNRSSDVFRLVMTENILLGLIGATIGVVLGLALAWVISAVGLPMPPPPNADRGYTAQIRVYPVTVLIAFAVGFAATVLAAPLAARRVSRTPIVDALRQNI
jgi:putative ABC transport system permease protein